MVLLSEKESKLEINDKKNNIFNSESKYETAIEGG